MKYSEWVNQIKELNQEFVRLLPTLILDSPQWDDLIVRFQALDDKQRHTPWEPETPVHEGTTRTEDFNAAIQETHRLRESLQDRYIEIGSIRRELRALQAAFTDTSGSLKIAQAEGNDLRKQLQGVCADLVDAQKELNLVCVKLGDAEVARDKAAEAYSGLCNIWATVPPRYQPYSHQQNLLTTANEKIEALEKETSTLKNNLWRMRAERDKAQQALAGEHELIATKNAEQRSLISAANEWAMKAENLRIELAHNADLLAKEASARYLAEARFTLVKEAVKRAQKDPLGDDAPPSSNVGGTCGGGGAAFGSASPSYTFGGPGQGVVGGFSSLGVIVTVGGDKKND